MAEIWSSGEILKIIFPLMSVQDLASCMRVCKQWRDVAKEDYFWKKLCAQRWPSMFKDKRPPPIGASRGYHKLYMSLCRRDRGALPVPRLSFDDIEFYVDIWLADRSVYSDVVPGSVLRSGIINPPAGICDIMKDHLKSLSCKMTIPVNPRFKLFSENIRVSLLVGRRDDDKVASIIDKSGFDYVDGPACRALTYDYLRFAPKYPFVSEIRAWIALLLVDSQDDKMDDKRDVFGIEVDFCDAANSDCEVLWLLDMLDWK
ncbi:hypothetical protein SUGI_0205670 [Cryptomeria japonica]|uniref:F-box protein At5g39250 n=1 Tax=Cryptomeria japonica TaxID=3369 RepID=UPI002408D335|nr:F-box protein At5g39250 [Cryptomeria japonica]GLJ13120.1 hypothetical protein SUGI_0205670 [Cryptomeria japonica]